MNRTELVETHGVIGHNDLGGHFGEPLTGLGHSLKGFSQFGFGFVTHGGQKVFRARWMVRIRRVWLFLRHERLRYLPQLRRSGVVAPT